MNDMGHEMADGMAGGPGATEPRGVYTFSPAQQAWLASYPAAYPAAQGAYAAPSALPYGAGAPLPSGAASYGAPYSPAQAEPDSREGMAIAALVLGIVSALAWLLPVCGFPFAVAGIVCGVLGRRSVSKRTLATIGLALAIAGLVLTFANAALGMYLASSGVLR